VSHDRDPLEVIAAACHASGWYIEADIARGARFVLEALCPSGCQVVLDRTTEPPVLRAVEPHGWTDGNRTAARSLLWPQLRLYREVDSPADRVPSEEQP
jgi:hypothetical protein